MTKENWNKGISKNDPFVQTFFGRIPPETAATFTDTQLAELKRVFQGRVEQQHAVDIRLSVPIFQRRFYLVYLLGKENRRLKRVQPAASTSANKILLTISSFILITSLFSTLYVATKIWGTNMPPQQAIKESIRVLFNKD